MYCIAVSVSATRASTEWHVREPNALRYVMVHDDDDDDDGA